MTGERQAPLREGLAVVGSGKYDPNLTVPVEVLKVTSVTAQVARKSIAFPTVKNG
jgi:hypothetical protein